MKRIDSRANALYRSWLKEKSRAGRVGSWVWLEGPHLCESWLSAGHQAQWLIVDEALLTEPPVQALLEQVDDGAQVLLGRGLFDALSEVKTPQGVLMLGVLPQYDLPQVLSDSVVILDAIQDPGNVGSILRSCAAAGVQTIMTTQHTAACWSPKVLRSAQGAHAGLKIYECGDAVAQWLSDYQTQAQRMQVIVTTLQDATDLYRCALPKKAIWIFGNEGQGVSPELAEFADLNVKIEHSQQYVESLNVGVAAALCLFEQRRQHV